MAEDESAKNRRCIHCDTLRIFSRSHLRPAPKDRISQQKSIFPQPVKERVLPTIRSSPPAEPHLNPEHERQMTLSKRSYHPVLQSQPHTM